MIQYFILILLNLAFVFQTQALEDLASREDRRSRGSGGQGSSGVRNVDHQGNEVIKEGKSTSSSLCKHGADRLYSENEEEENSAGEDSSSEVYSSEKFGLASKVSTKNFHGSKKEVNRRQDSAGAAEDDEEERRKKNLKKKRKQSSSEEDEESADDGKHRSKKGERKVLSVKEIMMKSRSRYQEGPNAGYDTEPLLEEDDILGHIRARIKERVQSLKEVLMNLKKEGFPLSDQQTYLEDQIKLKFPSPAAAQREIEQILCYETKMKTDTTGDFYRYLQENKYGIHSIIFEIVKAAKKTGEIWTKTDLAQVFIEKTGSFVDEKLKEERFSTFLDEMDLSSVLIVPKIIDVLEEHHGEVRTLVKALLEKYDPSNRQFRVILLQELESFARTKTDDKRAQNFREVRPRDTYLKSLLRRVQEGKGEEDQQTFEENKELPQNSMKRKKDLKFQHLGQERKKEERISWEEEEESKGEDETASEDEEGPHTTLLSQQRKIEDQAWEEHPLYLYIQENYDEVHEAIKKLALKSQGRKKISFIRQEFEKQFKQEFPSKHIAYRVIKYILTHPRNEKNVTVFPQYLNVHRQAMIDKIREWAKEAERDKKRITCKAIAERIVEEGKLDIEVSKVHARKIWSFCKENNIVLPQKPESIVDVLKDHYEEVKEKARNFFQTFAAKGKDTGFLQELRKELEAFSEAHSENPEAWKFPEEYSMVYRFCSSLFDEIGIKHADLCAVTRDFRVTTSVGKFLTNGNNSSFLEELSLRLAPDWFGGKKTQKQVGEAFEKAVKEESGDIVSVSETSGASGVRHLRNFFKKNADRLVKTQVQGNWVYTLKPVL